jgi:hypothetical protein
MQFLENLNKKRKTFFSDNNDENFKKPKLSPNVVSSLSKLDKDNICQQRKDLPIFTAKAR